MTDLSHFECNPKGCGMIFTSPKEINKIAGEHIHLRVIKHQKHPEVLSKDRVTLRQMTPEEELEYEDRFKTVLQAHLKDFKGLYPKNTVSVVKTKEDAGTIVYEIQMDYQEANKVQDGNDLVLACPGCGKEMYRLRGGWK